METKSPHRMEKMSQSVFGAMQLFKLRIKSKFPTLLNKNMCDLFSLPVWTWLHYSRSKVKMLYYFIM